MDDINVMLERHEQNIISLNKTIKEVRCNLEKLDHIGTSTEIADLNIKNMNERIEKIDARLLKLEEEPGSDYKHYKRLIIGSVLTGILGLLIGVITSFIIK